MAVGDASVSLIVRAANRIGFESFAAREDRG